jgi:hypothetical protein
MVPQGRRRVLLDLPASLARALRKLSAWNPTLDGPADVPELERFGWYREILTQGLAPAADISPAGWIVWAANNACETGTMPRADEVQEKLADWWKAQENAEEIDLAPALAACMLLDMRGVFDGDAEAAQAAVIYMHLIGGFAERSMHVEALATRWLGQPGMWHQAGIWERLRRVLPGPEKAAERPSDPRELDDGGPIHDLARSVLERTDPREPLSDPTPTQSPIAPVARSLLAAIGSLTSGEHWLQDAPVLARIAGLGRGLTPAVGRPAAQSSLMNCQRDLLAGLFRQVTLSGYPYALLPPVTGIPTSTGQLLMLR